jgi:hypothetical protein
MYVSAGTVYKVVQGIQVTSIQNIPRNLSDFPHLLFDFSEIDPTVQSGSTTSTGAAFGNLDFFGGMRRAAQFSAFFNFP